MRDFTWTFIVANTMKPLLEYDFLSQCGLTGDCKNKLIDTITNRQSDAKL